MIAVSHAFAADESRESKALVVAISALQLALIVLVWLLALAPMAVAALWAMAVEPMAPVGVKVAAALEP